MQQDIRKLFRVPLKNIDMETVADWGVVGHVQPGRNFRGGIKCSWDAIYNLHPIARRKYPGCCP